MFTPVGYAMGYVYGGVVRVQPFSRYYHSLSVSFLVCFGCFDAYYIELFIEIYVEADLLCYKVYQSDFVVNSCSLYLQVGGALGWRAAFWIESFLMLPLAIFGFVSKQVHLKGSYMLHL